MTNLITERDLSIVCDLVARARVFSKTQITEGYFNCQFTSARRRLNFLERAGWIVSRTAIVPTPPSIIRPIFAFKNLAESPDFTRLANSLRLRALSRRHAKQTLYTASAKAMKLILGQTRASSAPHHQTGHDLGFAEVVMFLKRHHPDQFESLRGEDTCSTPFLSGFVPDGLIMANGRTRVIEFGGDYDVERLRAIHNSCKEEGIDYDLY